MVPNQTTPDDNQSGQPVAPQIQSWASADSSVQIQGKHSFSHRVLSELLLLTFTP